MQCSARICIAVCEHVWCQLCRCFCIKAIVYGLECSMLVVPIASPASWQAIACRLLLAAVGPWGSCHGSTSLIPMAWSIPALPTCQKCCHLCNMMSTLLSVRDYAL